MESAEFSNVYDDERRASSYGQLDFPGTYYLAYRDLPAIVRKHVRGSKALDFGCGTGRSTRFLRDHGFAAVGVDIAEPMLARARDRDPDGDYRLVPDADLSSLEGERFDLILSVFTFDNIATADRKTTLLRSLEHLLEPHGVIVNVVSSPLIYVNEWTSFTTKDFPENREAKGGDTVRIVMLDVEDQRPVEDILWTEADYAQVYQNAGLAIVEVCSPLANSDEPFTWVSEMTIAPWNIYVLRPQP